MDAGYGVECQRGVESVQEGDLMIRISQTLYGFFDELEKVAFNMADAKKVLHLAKRKIIKVPRMRQAEKALQKMSPGDPLPFSVAEEMVLRGYGAPVGVGRGAHKVIERAQAAGLTAPMSPERIAQTRQLGGKIITGKGGDATAALRRAPNVGIAVREPISRMSGEQRMMHNAIIKNHELAEIGTKGGATQSAFSLATGHRGTQPPLLDNNMLATLPKKHGVVKETMQRYRPMEAYYLEQATRGVGGRPGLEFGEQRLSRHARKRVGQIMEKQTTENMQKHLAGPEGETVRKNLKAMGVQALKGIGNL
jgi:hypothetical protein